VGAWLPEPVLTGGRDDIEMVEQLSMAFLVLLESLTPPARAAFVLREVFEYPYDAIAAILDLSEAACRQLVSRGKRDLDARRQRFEVARAERDALAARFYEVCRSGDAAALERLLAEDVTFTGDGGGKAPAIARPLAGRGSVLKFVLGLIRIAQQSNFVLEPTEVNGRPGLTARDAAGRLVSVLSLEVADGAVAALYSVVNPEKLRHLGLAKPV
jgi:RNA polymerase sigma-70 factor (ECF subfamily)